jgi:hypothetical protein
LLLPLGWPPRKEEEKERKRERESERERKREREREKVTYLGDGSLMNSCTG